MDRIEKAQALFREGCNCSQAVFCAYCDIFGISQEEGLRLAEPFGGGMGRLRMTCGAVTGMFMLAGLQLGGGKPKDLEGRKRVYAAVQEMAAAFEEKNGSLICAELLGNSLPKDSSAVSTKRDSVFYKKRPCVACVGDCAQIAQKVLFEGTPSLPEKE